MTNFERYKDEIIEKSSIYPGMAAYELDNGDIEIVNCLRIDDCQKCFFSQGNNCNTFMWKWLAAEYENKKEEPYPIGTIIKIREKFQSCPKEAIILQHSKKQIEGEYHYLCLTEGAFTANIYSPDIEDVCGYSEDIVKFFEKKNV